METIAKVTEKTLIATPQNIAEIFKTGAPSDGGGEDAIRRRQESWLAKFYDLLLNSADHMEGALKKYTPAMLDKVEGRKPPLVKALMSIGYSEGTANKMQSQCRKFRDAYLNPAVRFIPERGTTWDQAYDVATKKLNERNKVLKVEKSKAQIRAEQGAYMAQEFARLSDDDRNDAQKVLEASRKASDLAAKEMRARKARTIAEAAFKAGGPELVDEIIDNLRQVLEDWQTVQSTGEDATESQEAARVNALAEQNATEPREAVRHAA